MGLLKLSFQLPLSVSYRYVFNHGVSSSILSSHYFFHLENFFRLLTAWYRFIQRVWIRSWAEIFGNWNWIRLQEWLTSRSWHYLFNVLLIYSSFIEFLSFLAKIFHWLYSVHWHTIDYDIAAPLVSLILTIKVLYIGNIAVGTLTTFLAWCCRSKLLIRKPTNIARIRELLIS